MQHEFITLKQYKYSFNTGLMIIKTKMNTFKLNINYKYNVLLFMMKSH